MEYQALTVGISDELFSGIESLLSSHIRLMPSLTVKDAAYLLEKSIFHLLIIDIEYLRKVHQSLGRTFVYQVSILTLSLQI